MATEHDADRPSASRSVAPPPEASRPPDDRPPEERPPESRRASTTRRAALVVPIVAVLVGLVVVIATLPSDPSLPWATAAPSLVAATDPPAVPQTGYLVDPGTLRERARRAAAGEEPYRAAVDDLLEWAATAVTEAAHPVDPILILGTSGPFVDDARRAYGLGLAYAVSGDERFAAAARATIRAWVDTARSTTDTCPDGGGCHTSLIIGRAGAGFAMGADLLAGSTAWTAADAADLRAWMHDVLLPAASHRPNNWGDAGTFLRIVAADYAGDAEEFAAAIEAWKANVDLIGADGRIPEEVRRGVAGIMYTQEALQYKVAVAEIAGRRGIDLWSYEGRLGGSLRDALDRLAYYWSRPDEWPDHPDPVVPSTGPVWEVAYARWGDPRWRPIIDDRRPYGDRGHSAIRWTTLTHGVPFEAVVAGGSTALPTATPRVTATPRPTATASPTPTPTASPTPTVVGASPGSADIDRLTARLRDPWGGALPVRIGWATTPDGSRVEVERELDGGAWRPVLTGAAPRIDVEVPIDTTVAYRVRTADDATAGPWSTIDDLRVRRSEVTSRTADLTGSWTRVSATTYSRGEALSTNDAGATLTWRGTARSLIAVGPVGPTRGRMVIDVDGARAEVVELYAPSFDARVALFSVHWADGREHEVRIEARHRDGRATVAIDDLVTLTADVTVVRDSSP